MDDQLPPGKLTTGAPPANLASLPLLPHELFVGRSEELATLLVALDGAAQGRGRIILIEGAAGIGKTHLAAELAERANARGIRAVWGRCFEDSAAPPYSPWIDVIRALSGDDDPAAAASALGADIQSAAEIVPALYHLASEPALCPPIVATAPGATCCAGRRPAAPDRRHLP